jgi:vitamin B12 transporter
VNGDGEIEVRGIEANGQWRLGEHWQLDADATRNLVDTREGVTVNNIPHFFARTRLGYEQDPWGFGMALRYVGSIVSPQGDDYGHYRVLDGDAYRYLDGARRHRLSLLLENLLDRDYATSRTTNGIRQVDNLGRPRTAELRYTFSF